MIEEVRVRPLVTPSVLLGAGLGAFANGILFRQFLQWHHVVSSAVPPVDAAALHANVVWDGVSYLIGWLFTVAGVVLLFRAARRDDVVWSGRIFSGTMLFGWGLYNFLEGMIDCVIAGIHHVRPGPHQLAWDLGFVAIGGVAFMIAGYLIGRTEISGDRMSPATRRALAL
jgi:uncharacterized membrane protein